MAVILTLFPVLPLQAAVQNRITQGIDNTRVTVFRGNVSPQARPLYDQGPASGSLWLPRIVLTFSRTPSQQADLDALLQAQQDPASPSYQQWLTPEEYADRFGLSASDLGQVVHWLQAQGFTVVETARSRTYVAFSGTAAQVRAAFGTGIHRYLVSGKTHYANASAPSLPAALADVVLGIRGLHNFRLRPRAVARRVRPEFTSSISGNHFLAPDDFATIYNLQPLYNLGIDGSGQTIAVMGDTDIVMSDIQTFRSVSGLPPNTPSVVLVPGSPDPGINNNEISEADLDLEWAGAVARNAAFIYVNSASGPLDSLLYAIDNNLAPVVSISYGDCEPDFSATDLNTLATSAQQANAQGITILAPAGDSGAADCDYSTNPNVQVTSATHGLAVDVPASIPYVTGVGGTEFNEGSGIYWSSTNNSSNGSALSYIPEVAWNGTATELASGGSITAGGGGASTVFAKPSWQSGLGVPNDGARDVPDLSFSASIDVDGYLICSQGSCVNGYRASDQTLYVVGGTSVGPPVMAGMVALINQQTQSRQGNINPRLYQLAASSGAVFHDITSGDNRVPCTAGTPNCASGGSIGYSAGPGYDQATGLGSVDAFSLVTEWTGSSAPPEPDFDLSTSAPSITLSRGSSGTAVVTVSALHGFAGSVSMSCTPSSALAGVTCSLTPSSLSGGGAATLTVTATVTLGSLRTPPGLPRSFPWTGGGMVFAVGLLLGGKRKSDGTSRSKVSLAMLVLFAVMLAGLALLPACGGGGSSSTSTSRSTTPVSGTVSVQATGAGLSHSIGVAVTVN